MLKKTFLLVLTAVLGGCSTPVVYRIPPPMPQARQVHQRFGVTKARVPIIPKPLVYPAFIFASADTNDGWYVLQSTNLTQWKNTGVLYTNPLPVNPSMPQCFYRLQQAAYVTLAWLPTAPTAVGYRIYWGTSSGAYASSVLVGNTNQASVFNLLPETRYFFTSTSVDASGAESSFSDEASCVTH